MPTATQTQPVTLAQLKSAIEGRNAAALIACYRDDAVVRVIDREPPLFATRPPITCRYFRSSGAREIRRWRHCSPGRRAGRYFYSAADRRRATARRSGLQRRARSNDASQEP